mgnify:CR=1 FL=1
MGNELWCDLRYFGGKYQVSTLGRIRRRHDGKILALYSHEKGYLKVDLEHRRARKKCRVHRLVAEAFVPNPFGYPQVNHINGIKTDNRAENLEWVTNQMNIDHAWRNGLYHRKRRKPYERP